MIRILLALLFCNNVFASDCFDKLESKDRALTASMKKIDVNTLIVTLIDSEIRALEYYKDVMMAGNYSMEELDSLSSEIFEDRPLRCFDRDWHNSNYKVYEYEYKEGAKIEEGFIMFKNNKPVNKLIMSLLYI